LTTQQKQVSVNMVRELLRILSVETTLQWNDVITLDKS
jgi:hypothetical protein